MTFAFTDLNWIAVVAAAVVGVVVGFIWYMPQVFGRRWAAAAGRELPAAGDTSPAVYVVGIVQSLLVAYVLTLLMDALGFSSVADGAILAVVVWVGFVATVAFNQVLYEGRSMEYWAINTGYALVALVLMGVVIGILGP